MFSGVALAVAASRDTTSQVFFVYLLTLLLPAAGLARGIASGVVPVTLLSYGQAVGSKGNMILARRSGRAPGRVEYAALWSGFFTRYATSTAPCFAPCGA